MVHYGPTVRPRSIPWYPLPPTMDTPPLVVPILRNQYSQYTPIITGYPTYRLPY